MTRYRDHRGGLHESMATQREVESKADLIAYLRPELARWGFQLTDDQLRVTPYGGDGARGVDDDRIGWKNVHVVIVEGLGAVGFVEGPLP